MKKTSKLIIIAGIIVMAIALLILIGWLPFNFHTKEVPDLVGYPMFIGLLICVIGLLLLAITHRKEISCAIKNFLNP